MTNTHLWWQRGTIYQIYPRSFMDSDGDGVGDLPGIISRLDYVRELGVDALWLSPIYPSPMADFGYDISDYTDVHPLFGTLADFDRLLAEAHARDLKVVLDLVPNHTSDEHAWFVESRSSRTSPKRDWYIWRDPAPDGGPPNNWLGSFGGSAWDLDPPTGQYYLHLFDKKQPDLNYRNPAVLAAMLDVMRFWLDRGVDGFRVDVIWMMIKDAQFRDNPPDPAMLPGEENLSKAQLPLYTADQPEVFEVIAQMRRVLDSYDERMMVGEIYLPLERLMAYYGSGGNGVHLPYNFQLILLPWEAHAVAAAIDAYEAALPPDGWPNWVLGNHDQPRVASRIGAAQARVAAMLLLTLRGTPTLYYGDELGMTNVVIPPELMHDPPARINPAFSRDPERTPMQWDGSANAGFSPATPWLPLADDYATNNVAAQRDDATSMLALHRRLLDLRRATPALEIGGYQRVPANGPIVAYQRIDAKQRLLVVLNFSAQPQQIYVPPSRILLSTHLDREGDITDIALTLRGDEGLIIEIDA